MKFFLTTLLLTPLFIYSQFWISGVSTSPNPVNDCDNLVKPILDSLKKMGKIVDDDIIFQLSITKYPTNGPERTEIICKEWLR